VFTDPFNGKGSIEMFSASNIVEGDSNIVEGDRLGWNCFGSVFFWFFFWFGFGSVFSVLGLEN